MHKSSIPSITEPGLHSVIVPNSSIIFTHRVNSDITSSPNSHDSLRLPSFDARTSRIARHEEVHQNGRSVAPAEQRGKVQSSKSDAGSHLLSGGYMSFEKMVNSPMHEFSPPLPPFRRKSDSDAPVRSPPGVFLLPSSSPVSPKSPGNFKKESKAPLDDEELKFCSQNSPDSNVTTSPESVLSPMSSDSPLPPSTPMSSPPSYLPTSPEGPSRPGGDDENYIRVKPHLTSPPSGQNSPCMICGDKSTGKHYGAHSCDGCKGFFRRSIRKSHNYSCRFDRSCNVTKDRRNQCRYCRLNKCLEVGMKKEAVQNERDRISQRRTPAPSCPPTPQPQSPPQPEGGSGITVEILLNAEDTYKKSNETRLEEMRTELRNKGLLGDAGRGAAGASCSVAPIGSCDVASLEDVAESVKQQLYGLVDFAKAIPQFNALHMDDKIKLLKAHSGEHLLLGIAWRSLSTDGFLVLGINKLIPRLESGVTVPYGRLNNTTSDLSTSNISWIASRVLDDIVGPLRQHKVNALEFLCLRTMIFFDPMLHGLLDRSAIQQNRLEVQLLLEDLISKRPDVPAKGRLGQIMFILPYLQTISGTMTQQIQLVKKDGVQSIDQIISEMLLGCFPEDERDEGADTLASPIIRMAPPHPTRSRVVDLDDERRCNDAMDRRYVRSPSSMEPCDLSYHPQQDGAVNYTSNAREQNLSDVHQPSAHIRQNGYSSHPPLGSHIRAHTHDHVQTREYYARGQQHFVNDDARQALDLQGNLKNNYSFSDVNGSYRTIGTHDSSNRKMYDPNTAEDLTSVEVSREYELQNHWDLTSNTLIDLSNSNMQNGVQGNRANPSPFESMEHSSVECMDTTPLDCSDRNHLQRMHNTLVDQRQHSFVQGRNQLIHHTSKIHSNGLLTPNNGMPVDRDSPRHFAKESELCVGSDGASMLETAPEPTEKVHGAVLVGPVRVNHYESLDSRNRALTRLQPDNRPVDCSSPQLPLNLRQRLNDR